LFPDEFDVGLFGFHNLDPDGNADWIRRRFRTL
jgi:hypothetical protein